MLQTFYSIIELAFLVLIMMAHVKVMQEELDMMRNAFEKKIGLLKDQLKSQSIKFRSPVDFKYPTDALILDRVTPVDLVPAQSRTRRKP